MKFENKQNSHFEMEGHGHLRWWGPEKVINERKKYFNGKLFIRSSGNALKHISSNWLLSVRRRYNNGSNGLMPWYNTA